MKSATEDVHYINFHNIPIVEFLNFIRKTCGANFIFDQKQLNFDVTVSSGKAVSTNQLLKGVSNLLKAHGFSVNREHDYYVIHKDSQDHSSSLDNQSVDFFNEDKNTEYSFCSYKLQYHEGLEIQEALKKIAVELKVKGQIPQKIISAVESIQWLKATNSLLYSGDQETQKVLNRLISSVDVPLKQVFIEVLVIETDISKSLEFGLEWAAGGQIKNQFSVGGSASAQKGPLSSFSDHVNQGQGRGSSVLSSGKGFDLGVIGDVILHKGRSYLTLGALVSALQMDGGSTIVLNQKIITQDNKNSKIFVGDNIPFTGSVVQTVGQSQQTTANIEYRDIGVNLSITPRLGEGDVISLDLEQEISESVNPTPFENNYQVNGIRTTKTNMLTHVHVPDKHFLVLSGMIRNAKTQHKAGLPCLGAAPYIGRAFSKTNQREEKRNILIFVRPHIIRSHQDYQTVSQKEMKKIENDASRKELLNILGE